MREVTVIVAVVFAFAVVAVFAIATMVSSEVDSECVTRYVKAGRHIDTARWICEQ